MEDDRQRYPNIYDLVLCNLYALRDQYSGHSATNSSAETLDRSFLFGFRVQAALMVSPMGNTRIWKRINMELAR
jgi:hypothetical protein